MNGDGHADIIVGAPQNDANGANAGRIYVYLGSDAGPEPNAAFSPTGENEDDKYGWSVATAGDVNGDGFDDIIIGAPQHDVGATPNVGKVYLYHGGPGGLGNVPAFTASGVISGTEFGVSVGAAGDVNNDGYADVIVGAHRDANSDGVDAGQAYVYLGSPTGLTPAAGWVTSGERAEDGYGVAVAGVGDVNGDGFDDVLVGANQYDAAETADAGRAYLYTGCSGSVLPTLAFMATGESNAGNFTPIKLGRACARRGRHQQ